MWELSFPVKAILLLLSGIFVTIGSEEVMLLETELPISIANAIPIMNGNSSVSKQPEPQPKAQYLIRWGFFSQTVAFGATLASGPTGGGGGV